MSSRLAVFDFDMTLADTRLLKPYRERHQWAECRRLAPRVAFYEGIQEALLHLHKEGVEIAVASSSPMTYLEPFIARLGAPLVEVRAFHDVSAAGRPPMVPVRAWIKAQHLTYFRQEAPRIVFVGDDADDAEGARIAETPFVHACWGVSTCDSIAALHIKAVSDLSVTLIENIG